MNIGEKIFVAALIALGLAVFVFAVIVFQDRADKCEKAGGALVRTAGGFVCAEDGLYTGIRI